MDNVKTTIPVKKLNGVDIDKEASLFGVSTTEIGAAVQFLTNSWAEDVVDDEVE